MSSKTPPSCREGAEQTSAGSIRFAAAEPPVFDGAQCALSAAQRMRQNNHSCWDRDRDRDNPSCRDLLSLHHPDPFTSGFLCQVRDKTRGNSLRLCQVLSLSQGRVGLDFRKDFFNEKMVRHWNWLLRGVVVEKLR